jgi:DNA polymerase-4
VRFADFHTVSRVRTLSGWTDATEAIYRAALDLYHSLDLDQPRIRLLGVRAEKLCDIADAAEQLVLDLPAPRGQHPVGSGTGAVPLSRRPSPDSAVDRARARFGTGAVQFGTLLPSDESLRPQPGGLERARKSATPEEMMNFAHHSQHQLSPP